MDIHLFNLTLKVLLCIIIWVWLLIPITILNILSLLMGYFWRTWTASYVYIYMFAH